MSAKHKKAIIAFLGNANHDSRVVNLIESLSAISIDVKTISFDWKTPNFKTQLGNTAIFKLDKSKSSLIYYLKFFYLTTKFLLKNKADIYFAEDIQTLPVVYFFAKLNKGKLFYNSREIYAHLAGLRKRNIVQSIISRIENRFIRKVDHVLVTGNMDEDFLKDSYKLDNFIVLRNLPKYQEKIEQVDLHKKLKIPKQCQIILYQGVLLEGRGILKIINIIGQLKNVHFVIVGGGEYKTHFEREAKKTEASNRIHFIGAVNHNELLNYTVGADLGLSLIENISISYYYALPNKLFEYIMAEIPILSSDLPQMKNVIDKYSVGEYVDPEDDVRLLECINKMLFDEGKLSDYKINCRKAKCVLNWETEFKLLEKYL